MVALELGVVGLVFSQDCIWSGSDSCALLMN